MSAVLMLTGCANNGAGAAPGTGDADGKVTLNFWTFWGSETRRPVIEKMIADFNASQDRIVVKHTYVPFSDIWTKNLAAIAAGNPPDVIVNDINGTALRAHKNQNLNLSQFLQQDPSLKDRFYPELWKSVMYKDEPYALPFNTDTRMMFYNKQAFREAGLDPEKFPQTWAELAEVAEKLDKKNGDQYERIGYAPQYGGFQWDVLMTNFDGGTGFFDKNGQPAVNTPAKLEALQYVKSYADRIGAKNLDQFKAGFGNNQSNPFITGKVAIWPEAVTFQTQLRDYGKGLDYGIAPIPEKAPGAGHLSVGGGFVLEIPRGAKHPAEAFEFMKYLTDTGPQTHWAQKNFDNVANKAASNDPQLQSDPVYQAAVENLKVTKLYPTPLHAPDYKNLIQPQVDAAINGEMDPKAALDQAQADVENLIKQNTGGE
ncbi:ABC transporter substrate-binding protein [Paenibacillus xerothermodurans]|uniref:ABC transporter substrate-binding protein n=2 Tax=Paenibacillus xerothermodurans TaxID=1977292 RepID=A0A2W1NYT5_PAEXE|nr:ABC transporter substrate-binding protein [Paenibacillus xerothermodurans]